VKRFDGKVAVITGAASGIGEATAHRLCEEGASVVLVDRQQDQLDAVVAALGDVATGVCADVRADTAAASAVDAAIERHGRLDVLVNNAGISVFGHVDELRDDQWERVMDVNVNAVFKMCRTALPHLIASGGSVVNTCSISGLLADPGLIAYNTSKGALLNFTRSLALDHAADGIRVNSVCPGGVATPMLKPTLDKWASEYERLIPMKRPAEAAEVAAAIAFLASGDASYITGHNLVIDGGVTAATGQPSFDHILRSSPAS